MAHMNFRRPLLHQLRLPYLLVVPVLLAVSAVLVLVLHGDVNATLLYSQCHSRSRLPVLSRIPVIGAPACFLVSFFTYASASMRAVAQFGAILAFVSALFTVCLIEALRPCNQMSWTVRHPTVSWLVMNLIGGTLAWDLWIVPAFLRRAKEIATERETQAVLEDEASRGQGGFDAEERVRIERSFLTVAEVYAIPVAVAVGFVLPSVLMLVFKHAVFVVVWLFFPVWVAIVRRAVELVTVKVVRDNGPFYLESRRLSVAFVYAVPFAASLLMHVLFIWNLFCRDDSREMTRMALRYIEINFAFIAATVLYWVIIEVGLKPAALFVASSVFLGPGAALCLTWTVRDRAICALALDNGEHTTFDEEDGDEDDSTVHENTPLLD
ncbi:hypothetical protein GGS20DRAFT_569053 [Poronia punctata]|nr:hypothetical protein GGS20DRAFT_569053 [Poronia punctata]